MNKKINFFKMFVLSSFLLGGIEAVQANNQYRYDNYDKQKEAAEWQERMELCENTRPNQQRGQEIHMYDVFFYRKDLNDEFNRYIESDTFNQLTTEAQNKIIKGREQGNVNYFYEANHMILNRLDEFLEPVECDDCNNLWNIICAVNMEYLCDFLKEFYKDRKDYSDHVINRFFFGGKKADNNAHYSGMISLIENVPYYANGDDRTLESGEDSYIRLFENKEPTKKYFPPQDTPQEMLRIMLAFVIAHSMCYNGGEEFYKIMEEDLTGGCERGKRNRLLQYINQLEVYNDNHSSFDKFTNIIRGVSYNESKKIDYINGHSKYITIHYSDDSSERIYYDKSNEDFMNNSFDQNNFYTYLWNGAKVFSGICTNLFKVCYNVVGGIFSFIIDVVNELSDHNSGVQERLLLNNPSIGMRAHRPYRDGFNMPQISSNDYDRSNNDNNARYIEYLYEKNKKLDEYWQSVVSLHNEINNNGGQSDSSIKDRLFGIWNELEEEYSNFIDKKEFSLNMNQDIEDLISDVICLINAIKTKMEGRGDSTIDFSQDEPHSNNSIRNAQNNVIEELDGYCNRINNIVRSGDKDRKHKLTNMYHEFLDKYSDYIEPQDRLNEDDGIQDFYDNFIGLITKVQNALQ